jgi:hypothetical protein
MRQGLLFLERRTFRAADLVITTNESHKRVAIQRGQKDPDYVIVVAAVPTWSGCTGLNRRPTGETGSLSWWSIWERSASRTGCITSSMR